MPAEGDGPGALVADAPPAASEAAATTRARMTHVPALDGVRGLAVAAVVLFHAGYLDGGWLGVDLFFVLSGYLITSLLMVEHRGSGRIDLVAFWGRRARRLLPALALVLIAVAVYALIDLTPADLARVRGDGLATVFFVANWHDILGGVSYWDRGLAPSMFAHMWSLAVEEQLYIVWPVLLTLLFRRFGRRQAVVVRAAGTLAVASAALALGLYAAGASTARIYLGTDTRAVAVALGALVAGARRRPGGISKATARRLESVAILAAIGLGYAWWGLQGTSPVTYQGGLLAASALGAIVVAAAADPRSVRMARVLSVAPLRRLGEISYGVYLWHWPIGVVLNAQRTGLDGLALLALRIGVTLALAIVSYVLIERPIRERRPTGWWEGRQGRASAIVAVAGMVMVILLATLGAEALPTEGLAGGVVRPAAPIAGAPKVVVLGDSVAAAVAAPAIAHPTGYGLNVVRSTVLGCQAIWDGQHRARGIEHDVSLPPECPRSVGALVLREHPDAVLILYGGWTDAEFQLGGHWYRACDPAYEQALDARFTQVLHDARLTGAPVIVTKAARSTNTFRRKDNWAHTRCTNQVMERVARRTKGVSVLDLDSWLCPKGHCKEKIDGLLVRSDGVHFQGPGGAKVGRWIFDQARRIAGLGAAPGVAADPAEEALARVCGAYAEVLSVSDTLTKDGLGTPGTKDKLLSALAVLDTATLGELDPEVATDIAPLADPELKSTLADLLDRAVAGQQLTVDDVPPGIIFSLNNALNRLKQTC